MRLLALAAATLAAALPATAAQARDFPREFLWGTAISGFQTEAGGGSANSDPRTDWWEWVRDPANVERGRVSGDLPEAGPGHWSRWRRDVDLARSALGANAYRMSIEWSRIFPRSTRRARGLRRLDRMADRSAVRRYRREIRRVRRRGMTPFVTLNHFTLPSWAHDPIATRDALARLGPDDPLPRPLPARAGWLDARTIAEFAKYAAYLGWKLGDLVDLWAPLNEPMVVATSGYVNVEGAFAGWFPPGVLSYPAALRVVRNLARANAVAYRALHRHDRHARVGPVHNMIAFTPANPASAADVRGVRHASYLFNEVFPNAVVGGFEDRDADSRVDRGERNRSLRGTADFLGLNYYFRGRVTGLPGPVSTTIPVLDFVPATSYRRPENPSAPPCPTRCTEFGWEIYPEGLEEVLRIAGRYALPVYVTENGIADDDDDERAGYLLSHLRELRAAMRRRVARVRGYFHWTLVDNFEWSSGYQPRFGLFSYDPATLERRARPSARLFARIARSGSLPR